MTTCTSRLHPHGVLAAAVLCLFVAVLCRGSSTGRPNKNRWPYSPFSVVALRSGLLNSPRGSLELLRARLM
eukprot:6917708-Alexandrium_andersonii.AAC.1